MSLASKEKVEPELLSPTRGVSRIYRALTLLQARLSDWKPEAETLLSRYGRTGDPHDYQAFAFHVTGELARLRETLEREVGQ